MSNIANVGMIINIRTKFRHLCQLSPPHEGLEIGNINSVEGVKYPMAKEMLANPDTMQLTPMSHGEQVKALSSNFLESQLPSSIAYKNLCLKTIRP